MATARDICSRALRKARVVAHGNDAAAEDAAAALEDLNMMLAAWKLAGVDITHVALDFADAFPLADEFEEGTVYMLADRIAHDFRFPMGFDADDFFRKIQAAYMTIAKVTMPAPLRRMPSQYWPNPITRGEDT